MPFYFPPVPTQVAAAHVISKGLIALDEDLLEMGFARQGPVSHTKTSARENSNVGNIFYICRSYFWSAIEERKVKKKRYAGKPKQVGI